MDLDERDAVVYAAAGADSAWVGNDAPWMLPKRISGADKVVPETLCAA